MGATHWTETFKILLIYWMTLHMARPPSAKLRECVNSLVEEENSHLKRVSAAARLARPLEEGDKTALDP
jgi:hypothetical protein